MFDEKIKPYKLLLQYCIKQIIKIANNFIGWFLFFFELLYKDKKKKFTCSIFSSFVCENTINLIKC